MYTSRFAAGIRDKSVVHKNRADCPLGVGSELIPQMKIKFKGLVHK